MSAENIEAKFCDLKDKGSCCSSGEQLKVNLRSHWDEVYNNQPIDQLGWYEASPEPSLRLIEKANLSEGASILNVGAGATTLVDELLKQGYENIIINDLSRVALNKLKERLGNQTNQIQWIADDLTAPEKLSGLPQVDLWHDRAVLHFFVEAQDRKTYFDLVRKLVKPHGYVIIAAFNFNGATSCSGLPVYRYDQAMLQNQLGDDFKLTDAFNYTYTMPSGDTRAYIYTMFKRN